MVVPVEGDDPELDDPEPVDPAPLFGDDPAGAPAVPGMVPQGEPLGVVPGVVEVFGFTVEG